MKWANGASAQRRAPLGLQICGKKKRQWQLAKPVAASLLMKHLTPIEAHDFLRSNSDAVFVDVRSEIEFFYVGHPVAAEHIAWQEPPDWDVQPEFAQHVKALVAGVKSRPVVLICRSGKRSVDAGKVLENAGFSDVYNVLHGFEGDLDEHFHRGDKSGWRFDGLPWAQM